MITKTFHYPDRTLNIIAEQSNDNKIWYVTIKRLDVYGNTDVTTKPMTHNQLVKYLKVLDSTSLNQMSIKFFQQNIYLNPDNYFDYCGCTYDLFNHRTIFTSQPNRMWQWK